MANIGGRAVLRGAGQDSCDHNGAKTSGGSADVWINGYPAHRVGDTWQRHNRSQYEVHYPSSDPILSSGSMTVYVNGVSLGRIGDELNCGASATTGSSNVYAGG